MENIPEFNIVDIINKQIFNINWESRLPVFENTNPSLSSMSLTQNNLGNDIGILIDNGSFECRAGWSYDESPSVRFRSIVAKPKVQTNGQESLFLVGNEILSIEQGKLHKKSPFEKNYIAHFGTQEHLLDHLFSRLNIKSSEVEHPVVFSEPICNLNWSRKNISEMMFELYSVPSLCYGVDMLFSLEYNCTPGKSKSKSDQNNCLVISSSYQTTHIVPILNGRIVLDKVRRISIGAFHSNEMLTKSLHLRFPDIRNKFSNELIQEIQENYTMCAKDYKKQLQLFQGVFQYDQEQLKDQEKKRMFGSLEMYEKANKDEIKEKKLSESKNKRLKVYKNFVQYNNEMYDRDCFSNPTLNQNLFSSNLITDLIFFEWPKISNEIILTEEEMRRKEDVRKEQSRRLREVMQKKREENFKNLEKELEELELISNLKDKDNYQFEEALLSKGFTSNEELQKRMNKIFMKINVNKENNKDEEKIAEEKRWPLLNIPDEDLTEDQIKMKKIHKMQRQAFLNRLEKRERQKREKEKVEELKQRDPENYLISLYRKKKELSDKIEKYKQIRKDITSRSSKFNRGRMIMLAELGKDVTEKSKKGEINVDNFGQNDEDWEVYRGISRHNLSEDEEEDQQQLQEIETQIIEVDPTYFKYSETCAQGYMFNTSHFCLGVDQFRGAELLFQPHIIGSEQSGLTETIISVLKSMTFEERRLLAGNIFLTGGHANTRYLKERIFLDLRAELHCDIDINITLAQDPLLDAWKGEKIFYENKENKNYFVTRAEYLECGAEYFKEHNCSNIPINRGSFSYDSTHKKRKLI